MCLIVYKDSPKGKFTNDNFTSMLKSNSDGLGMMVRHEGRILVEKSVGNFEEKLKLYRKFRDNPHWAMHARYKTHGAIDLPNCHPYKILNIDDGDKLDLYMMHNGVINTPVDKDIKMSDTWNFIETFLKPIAKSNVELLWTIEFSKYVERLIGGSKLLFMRGDDHKLPVVIYNEKAGSTVNNCWLSNTHSVYDYTRPNNYRTTHTPAPAPAPVTRLPAIIKPDNTYKPNMWWERNTGGYSGPVNDYVATNEVLRAVDKEFNTPITKETQWEEGESCSKEGTDIKPIAQASNLPTKDQVISGIRNHIHDLQTSLQVMKQYKDDEIVVIMREDPDHIADIISTLYEKGTMTKEVIKDCIANDTKALHLVALIRNLSHRDLRAA